MDQRTQTLLCYTQEAAARADALRREMELPEAAADSRYYRRLTLEAARLAPFAEAHARLSRIAADLDKCREAIPTAEGELRALLQEEERALSTELQAAQADADALTHLAQSGGNAPAVLTVRCTQRSKFGGDVLHLYAHYLDLSGIAYTLAEYDWGGTIEAEGGLGRLKGESGLHRRTDGVDCTVSVMPRKVTGEIRVSPEDIRVDIFCSSGKGGQNVNKVETAVRITHIPTGTVVTCQDERSQLMNKRRALATLETRLNERTQRATDADYVKERDAQVRDRSNAIRRHDIDKNVLRDTRTGETVPLKEGMRGKIERLIMSVARMGL